MPRMIISRLFLAVFFTISPYLSLSLQGLLPNGEPDWQQLNDPQLLGGDVIALVEAPSAPEVLYALLRSPEGYRFFRSDNAGEMWSQPYVFSQIMTEIGVDPDNPEIVYIGSDDGLRRSTDGGDHWDLIYPVGKTFVLVSSDKIYTAGPIGPGDPAWEMLTFSIACINSEGIEWHTPSVINAARLDRIAAVPTNPNVVYIAAEMYLSHDTLLKSSDEVQTWEILASTLGGDITALTIDPISPERVYVSGASGFYYSHDGGVSWNYGGKLLDSYGRIAVQDGIVYVVSSRHAPSSVYRSDDGGINWWISLYRLPNGANSLSASTAFPGRLYAGLNAYGIYRSDTSGSLWNAKNQGIYIDAKGTALAIATGEPNLIYLASGSDRPELFRSEDGGLQWSNPLLNLEPYYESPSEIRTMAVDPQNADVAWAGGVDGLYVSFDGVHWSLNLNWVEVADIAVNQQKPDYPYILANSPGVLYPAFIYSPIKPSSNGYSWSSYPIPGIIWACALWADPTNSQHLLVAGVEYAQSGKNIGILESKDSGATWKNIGQIDTSILVSEMIFSPIDTSTILASTTDYSMDNNRVYRSLDGGVSWSDWSEGLPLSGSQYAPLIINQSGVAYYGATNGVYRRGPGDTAWILDGLPGQSIHTLATDGTQASELYAATNQGLYRRHLDIPLGYWLPLIFR